MSLASRLQSGQAARHVEARTAEYALRLERNPMTWHQTCSRPPTAVVGAVKAAGAAGETGTAHEYGSEAPTTQRQPRKKAKKKGGRSRRAGGRVRSGQTVAGTCHDSPGSIGGRNGGDNCGVTNVKLQKKVRGAREKRRAHSEAR